MNNQELNEYIKHYLKEDKTKSAIMLNAPWGTGKSYYIINTLRPYLESEENGRLHFHAIIRIPEGKMIGELFEKRDYDVVNHKMQTTTQNTYFNERFGRTDFVEINTFVLGDTIKYLVKYLSKTNEYAVFSRGIKPFIEADLWVEDI